MATTQRIRAALLLVVMLARVSSAAQEPWSVQADRPLLVAYQSSTELTPAVSEEAQPLADFNDPVDYWAADTYFPTISQSSWYFRLDYFHWNEMVAGANFVNEYGVLPTIGYFRRVDQERLRLEMFGNQVRYHGGLQDGSGTVIPYSFYTNYIGGRIEYDRFLYPDLFRRFELLVGIGWRIWDRNLLNSSTVQSGYHELWNTLYPYVGLETRHDPSQAWEFFGRGRVGVTAFNYEYANAAGGVNLYPVASITGLVEAGIRGDQLSLSAYLESFAWKESPVAYGFRQPDSTMVLIGLQAGYNY